MAASAICFIPPRSSSYWVEVRKRAKQLGGNHCTGVPDFYSDACDEHDIHYRTGYSLWNQRLTRKMADKRLRLVIQNRSPFGRFSPMAWWRWVGVRLLGRKSWNPALHSAIPNHRQ